MAKNSITNSKYVQGAVQQAKDANAWFWAFWAMVILLVVGFDTHKSIINKNEKILVPYNVATLDKAVKYSGDFSRPEDYLSLISMADAYLWGNWTHDNIEQRMKRFEKRLSRGLLSQMKADLAFQASENSKNHIDQRIVVDGDISADRKEGKLRIPIRIERTILGVVEPARSAFLYLGYLNDDGVPMINTFEFNYVRGFDK